MSFDLHLLWHLRELKKAKGHCEGSASARDEVNRKDESGRTVLHLIASETDASSLEWLNMVLAVTGVNPNLMDRESGWTALARALYAGNITAAAALLARSDVDTQLKDREGLTAFDLYNSTVSGTNPADSQTTSLAPRSELFTWGSNKNFTLGLQGDGDRAFPENVKLVRSRIAGSGLKAFEPIRVRTVRLSRLHSAILTDEAGVRMCGYGTGGRIGPTSHAQFEFTPLHDFPYRVSAIALSPDHTVIVTSEGSVFTFGTNRFSQLGYAVEATSYRSANDEAVQGVPKRVAGAIKKEFIIGASACRNSTAVFSAEGLFTWGTNAGQLGYASATGSKLQVTPRKVTILNDVPITAVSVTDTATACLTSTGDVLVLCHESFVKIAFPLSRFPTSMSTYRPPQISSKRSITKVVSSGSSFIVLSSLGDVFSFSLDLSDSSTYRPVIKPQRVWSQRKAFTAVTDIGIGLDAIILSTVSGHVYVKNKRFDGSKTSAAPSTRAGSWNRVPNLQRVTKVTVSSSGAYAAIRSDVPLRLISIEGPSLSEDVLKLLPHWRRSAKRVGGTKGKSRKRDVDSDDEEAMDVGIESDVVESFRMVEILKEWDSSWEVHLGGSDVYIEVANGFKFPAHRLVLASRSPVLARQLSTAASIVLPVSPFTALLLLHYIYSDSFPTIWDSRISYRLLEASVQLNVALVKSELQGLAIQLQLPALTRSLSSHVKSPPTPALSRICSQLLSNVGITSSITPDVLLRLADDRSVSCHSVILRARSTFFATFYDDPDWSRRRKSNGVVTFDLTHVRSEVMEVVLRHLYEDCELALFEDLERETSDEVVEFVIEVLGVANEFLADKLKLICSAVLRRYITLNNVGSILVDAAHFEAHDLVRIIMDYLACSMETALEGRLLDHLSPEIINAISIYVQGRQALRLPLSRSGILVSDLMVKWSSYISDLDYSRPTGGAFKFSMLKGKGRLTRSPHLTPTVLSAAASPRIRSPATSPFLPPLRESIPFEMDDFSLDARWVDSRKAPSIASPISPPLPLSRSGWSKVESTRSPLDLRSIIAAESVEVKARSIPGLDTSARSFTPRSSGPSTPLSTSAPRATPSLHSWQSVDATSPSFLNIQSQQSTPSRSVDRPRIPISSSPASSSGINRDPSSAVGANVITPVRLAPRSSTGSNRKSSYSGFGAADVPWTNYVATPVSFSPSSPTPSLPSALPAAHSAPRSPPAAPPVFSFASIQQEQQNVVASVKAQQVIRSFAEVLAEEAAEAARRTEETSRLNEEVEFQKWWDAEAERMRVESEAENRTINAMIASSGGSGRGRRGKKPNGNKSNGGSDREAIVNGSASGTGSRNGTRGGAGRGRGGSSRGANRGGNQNAGNPSIATFVDA